MTRQITGASEMPKAGSGEIDVGVEILGMKLRHPIMLASGILGETADLLLAAHRAGAAAVVTKSIGIEPKDGHQNPTVFPLGFGLLNAMGLPNPGIDEFGKEMERLTCSGANVIGSVFASKPAEFAVLANKMEQYGARVVELNLSCPHAKGYGTEIGSSPASVRSIVRSAVSAVSIPVLAKLTPNTSDICSLGLAAEEAGASAVVAINTLRAMEIDPRLRRPVLGSRFGGLSGSAIRPVGIRCVFELYEALSIPIIGVGGICSAIDVAKYIMAGASAVQVGSVIYDKGLDAFSLLEKELRSFMKEEGIGSISQMRGMAHES